MKNTRYIMHGSLTRTRWHAALWVSGVFAPVTCARSLRPEGEIL